MHKKIKLILVCVGVKCLGLMSIAVNAHDFSASANYLGNEGVMVEENGVKILFDPFFHNNYSQYTLVPAQMRKDIFAQKSPYDNVKLVFISHAHGDHFDKNDAVKYLQLNKNAKLIAPVDAVSQIKTVADYENVKSRIISVNIKKGDAPQLNEYEGIQIESVRIPHAGWPKLAELSNIVYRVQMKQQTTVMHMGDADPDPQHFTEQSEFWPKKVTHNAFPPYWFSLYPTGQTILKDMIKAKHVIGVHVPTKVPQNLKDTGTDYFSKPGESRKIDVSHQH